jgi:membrane protease YdiL (CAAX protease family)
VVIAIPMALLGFTDLEQLSQLALVATSIAFLPSVTLATWIARRWIDRRSFRSLGLEIDGRSLRDLGVGFAIPLPLFGLVTLVEAALGWLEFEGWAWADPDPLIAVGAPLGMLVVFAAVGFYEELLFRGYYLYNMIDGANLPFAILTSSLIFALAHLTNFGASFFSTIGIFAAGIFLTYGWLRTGALWLPIGLHIGWNFFQGPIFGFSVSGNPTPALIHQQVNGPELITGGEFGPEAGLIALPIMAVGMVLIWWYTRGRNGDLATAETAEQSNHPLD